MRPLRILIADDHEVVRRGVRTILAAQPNWEICGEATTGREAVEKAKQYKPDVVLLDITMPELSGLEAARQIVKALPHTEVLILTIHESEQMARTALEAGARGYILKSDAVRDLLTGVESISRHKPFFTSHVSEMLLKRSLRPDAITEESPWRHLTAREREIVRLLAEGKSNKEIACELGISVRTAEAHRANITRKLEVHSAVELVRYAVRHKLVEI